MKLYIYKKFSDRPGIYTTDAALIELLLEHPKRFEPWFRVIKKSKLVGRAFLHVHRGKLSDFREMMKSWRKRALKRQPSKPTRSK